MFWKFLLKMSVADLLCVYVFAFALVVVLAPLLLIARKESRTKFAGPPLVVVAAAFQIYFWGLWAAFCSATAAKYQQCRKSLSWLYYLAAFAFCTAPLAYLAHKETMMAQSSAEVSNTERGTALYSLLAIAAFLVFSVWPSLYSWAYSWALGFVV